MKMILQASLIAKLLIALIAIFIISRLLAPLLQNLFTHFILKDKSKNHDIDSLIRHKLHEMQSSTSSSVTSNSTSATTNVSPLEKRLREREEQGHLHDSLELMLSPFKGLDWGQSQKEEEIKTMAKEKFNVILGSKMIHKGLSLYSKEAHLSHFKSLPSDYAHFIYLITLSCIFLQLLSSSKEEDLMLLYCFFFNHKRPELFSLSQLQSMKAENDLTLIKKIALFYDKHMAKGDELEKIQSHFLTLQSLYQALYFLTNNDLEHLSTQQVFSLFKISPQASDLEKKRAYKAWAKKLHPDQYQMLDLSQEMIKRLNLNFSKIQELYSIINNED